MAAQCLRHAMPLGLESHGGRRDLIGNRDIPDFCRTLGLRVVGTQKYLIVFGNQPARCDPALAAEFHGICATKRSPERSRQLEASHGRIATVSFKITTI